MMIMDDDSGDELTWLEGATVEIMEDGRRRFGVEDASQFPVGIWRRIYVPADRFTEVSEALQRIGTPAAADAPLETHEVL